MTQIGCYYAMFVSLDHIAVLSSIRFVASYRIIPFQDLEKQT